ncbi:MAG: FAD:protein FMN transferase [Candidatus Latescibacterota bacterium]|nr:FAD:protein FMN transferase [Candidatus Latescibacterota bacterium]
MLKRSLLAVGGLVLVLFFLPAPQPAEPVREDRLTLGTLVTVKLYGDETEVRPHIERAFTELDRVDSLMSRYRQDGELRRLERAALDGASASAELIAVLARSQHFAALTGGAFDCTVGALTALWGFPDAVAPPARAQIDSALALVGYEGLEVAAASIRIARPGLRLDLGAAAKGFAVDRMVAALEELGVVAGLIDAGGDIRYWGQKPDGRPWRFGVQHPRDPQCYIEVEDLGLAAIATSGDYQQYFEWQGERYHHLLDPQTGYPARGCISATVWAATALDADILSTAVFVLGPERGLELVAGLDRVEALVFFERDGQLAHRASAGVSGRFRFME